MGIHTTSFKLLWQGAILTVPDMLRAASVWLAACGAHCALHSTAKLKQQSS